MSGIFDPVSDIAILDGFEYVDVRDSSESVEVAGVISHRSQLSFRELQFSDGIGLSTKDVAFRLDAAALKFTPDQGDVVRDGNGDCWAILSVSGCGPGRLVSTWRCVCRKQPK